MQLFQITTPAAVGAQAKALFNEERSEHKVLNGWLLCREISAQVDAQCGETFPELRGSITNLSTDNFTPLSLLYGMMRGMAEELHGMYRRSGLAGGTFYGSGNGLRKNPHLRRCFEEAFGRPLLLSQNEEEAACGAALFASLQ